VIFIDTSRYRLINGAKGRSNMSGSTACGRECPAFDDPSLHHHHLDRVKGRSGRERVVPQKQEARDLTWFDRPVIGQAEKARVLRRSGCEQLAG